MTVLNCPLCDYATPDVECVGAASILSAHAISHQQPPQAAPAAVIRNRAPKLERPKVKAGITSEEWNAYFRRWSTYRTGSDIGDDIASSQLLECATEDLKDIVLRAHPTFTSKNIDEAVKLLRSLAVVPTALGVIRSELSSMYQGADESFRTFAAKVQGKAETCEFITAFSGKCSDPDCGRDYTGETYYTDEVIRDVLLNGVADTDIRREALSVEGIQKQSINDIIAFVETRETARDANQPSSVSAASNRPPRRSGNRSGPFTPSVAEQALTAPCPDCGTPFHLHSRTRNGWNKKPHERCVDCWRKVNIHAKAQHNMIGVVEQFGQISTLSQSEETCPEDTQPSQDSSPPPTSPATRVNSTPQPEIVNPVLRPSNARRLRRYRHRRRRKPPAISALTHHAFTKHGWRRARLSPHPRVNLSLQHDRYPNRSADIDAVADSGAQMDLYGKEDYLKAGFNIKDLTPVSLALEAANKSAIQLEGAFFATITGIKADGSSISHKSMVYVSKDIHGFYLSEATMLELKMLSKDFPTPGCALPEMTPEVATATGNADPPSSSSPAPNFDPVPPRPAELPFPCKPENNELFRDWCLRTYRFSADDKLPPEPLPCMVGPPMEIHLDENAKPRVCHKARPVPVYWGEQVCNDLLDDKKRDVLERPPLGEPITWCHQMVLTSKHDGSPRRTVDLSPLNKYCKRETHNSESPFHVARRVPAKTWKTVVDIKDGYHSIELKESDRHLTTFATPFGLWRYKRAPQGYVSSGDAFNRRLDTILADFERKERVVDDILHYDTDLEAHWWRIIDLLVLLGNSGVTLNHKKFQCAQRSVEFAGFLISEDRIEPLQKYFSAIQDFPTPTSTTDIRSWFGLVNQVAHYAQLRDMMAPFRPFLSAKKQPFFWNDELNTAFNASKEAIVAAIREGVEIFDPMRKTCLRPDWSKKGIGYFLLQQHCDCPSGLPDCCENGWRITLAGSRFLQQAESRYAPVEGEALAVAWALEQTRFFTQGCDDLLIVTDHKPLVKILGDRTLDEIQNTRLFRLKQRTLPWRYRITHLPGKTNHAADAISRYPASDGSPSLLGTNDRVETAIVAALRSATASNFSLSWETLSQETEADSTMQLLLHYVRSGFPLKLPQDNNTLRPYWQYRFALYEQDGVLLYNDRVLVPPRFRQHAIQTLHAAHQGVSAMEARARATIFWPGLTVDINNARANCRDCITNAPSQARLPPAAYDPPTTPFEKIASDYFHSGGYYYLVVADRLSGWPEVFKSPVGTPQSGAEGLIACLRNCFACFGVPNELSSDGGPEFSAHKTSDFLQRWGVHHRDSSAYHPQSNGRAEVAVKSMKRLLRSNTGADGSLNNDQFLRAILQLRNTPDPDCHLSPAEIMFGRPLRDAFSFVNRLEKFTNPHLRPTWRDAWQQKESALRQRFHRTSEALLTHTRPLPLLSPGDRCYVQNQTGRYPKRWDRSGTVMESLGHDSYTVKIDGSGRLTKRNRQFLRKFIPPLLDAPSRCLQPTLPAPPARVLSQPASGPLANIGRTVLNPQGHVHQQTTPDGTLTTGPDPHAIDSPRCIDSPSVPTLDSLDDCSSNEGPPPTLTDTEMNTDTPHVEEDTAGNALSPGGVRPRRAKTAPRRYEPESGLWV